MTYVKGLKFQIPRSKFQGRNLGLETWGLGLVFVFFKTKRGANIIKRERGFKCDFFDEWRFDKL